MKKLLFSLLGFFVSQFLAAQYCGNSGALQCTPIGGAPQFGTVQMSDSLQCAETNVHYDNAAQFIMMNTLNFQGQQQVDSIEIVSIGNLPCGLCWSTNKPNNRYAANEDGCLRITGTSADAIGQYKLSLSFKMWINGQPTALTVPAALADQMDIRLFLKVQPNAVSCPATDTSSGANNLTATANCGNGNPPVADFNWVNYPYYPGYVVQFSDLSTNSPTSWIWSFGDGSGSTVQNPGKNFTSPGVYNVCLKATNPFGTSTLVCKDVTVQASATLTAQLTNTDACANSQITIQPQVAGGTPPYTYYWSAIGDMLSCSTCQNPQLTLTQTSSYTLTVIDAINNSATATVNYSLNPGTNNMQLAANSTAISCLSLTDTTTLNIANGNAPYRIYWGDGDTLSTGPSATHNYNEAGNFVITVTDNSNCITSLVQNVPFDGIDITALQTVQPACMGDSTGKIKITTTGGTPPYNYNWNNGSGTDSIFNVVPGIYHVTVTDATACSFAHMFNLAPQNGWGYYAYTSASGSNCNNNGSVSVSVYGGLTPYNYAWNTGNTGQTITGLTGGIYAITVTDAAGCSTSANALVPTNCYSIISGNVFNDQNNNCILDVGENALSQAIFITAQSNSGQTYYGYASANGDYNIMVSEAGTFTLGASSGGGTCGVLMLCNNANHIVTIATLGDTSMNNNFGFSGAPGFDLTIHPGWTTGNPGFEKQYWIFCGNNTITQPGPHPTVTFNYDENLIYQSSNPPAQHNLATHTLTWLLDSVPGNSSFWGQQLYCMFMVPQTLSLGHLLHSSFRMDPTVGDCDSSNNKLFVSETVVGSHDPNEKKVEPANDIIEEDSVLTYTIGFQNTGTDSTHFIIIKDTLSPYLDPATVRNIASSHPYSDFSVSGTGILTWTFNPLRLVDSFTNEPGSHGFVKFTIKKKANLPLFTQISNTAHIYFDYNPAVVTNTVTNRLTEPTGILHVRATDNVKVKAIPNPFSDGTNIVVEGVNGRFDFELYDITGKLQNRISSIETNQFHVTRDNLSAGVYLFKISTTDKKKTGYGKLVVE